MRFRLSAWPHTVEPHPADRRMRSLFAPWHQDQLGVARGLALLGIIERG